MLGTVWDVFLGPMLHPPPGGALSGAHCHTTVSALCETELLRAKPTLFR